MIFLVLEYRFGLVRRDRVLWEEQAPHPANPVDAAVPANGLSALARAVGQAPPAKRTEPASAESL